MHRRAGFALFFWGLCALALHGCGSAAAVYFGTKSDHRTQPLIPPNVTAVAPTSATHAGGVTITITGDHFPTAPVPVVTVNGAPASNVTVNANGTQLSATLPAGEVGPATVTVNNLPIGSGSLSGGFSYINHRPVASQVGVGGLGIVNGNVVFTVTLADGDADPADLTVALVDASDTVLGTIPASDILSLPGLAGLASSTGGVPHSLTWRSTGLFAAQNLTQVRLRVTPRDQVESTQDGGVAVSPAFDLLNNTNLAAEILQPSDDAFDVVLRYNIVDPDPSDPLEVKSLTYRNVTTGATGSLTVKSGQGTGSLQSSETVWDSKADLGFGNNHQVVVTITLSDGQNPDVTTSTQPFLIDNGPLVNQVIRQVLLRSDATTVADITSDARPDVASCTTNNVDERGRISVLRNLGQDFGTATVSEVPDIAGLPATGNANPFASGYGHPSECAVLDVDGDGDLDLLAANSVYAPYTESKSFLSGTTLVLEAFGFAGANVANTMLHQSTLVIDQQGGVLGVTTATYTSSQAPIARPAGVAAGDPAWTPIAGAGAHLVNIGWFAQDVVAANLDPPDLPGDAAPTNAGATDLVTLHAFAQLDAGSKGCVVIQQVDAAGVLSPTTFYLNPQNMGTLPTHCAVADVTSSAHDLTLAPPPVGGAPFGSTPGGTPDIVVANSGDNSLTFYLQQSRATTPGTTAPTFASVRLTMDVVRQKTSYATALPLGDTIGVAIGDLNGDGANDLIVVGRLSRTIFPLIYDPDPAATGSVMPNTGNYLPFRVLEPIILPQQFVGRPRIADVTNDGRADLLIPATLLNELLIYENLGNASFGAAPIRYTTRFQPFEVFPAQLNGDDRVDIIVSCSLSSDISIFYQSTPGTLDQFIAVASEGFGPFLLDQGDLDADGKPELVVALSGENKVFVYDPLPNGRLQKSLEYDVSPALQPFLVSTGDATGDGVDDLLIALQIVNGKGGWGLVQGGSTPAAITSITEGTFGPIGFSVATGDFLYPGGVPDGYPDVVVAYNGGQGLDVYRGGPTGLTLDRSVTQSPRRPAQVQIADLDLDGHPDIVLGNGDRAQKDMVVYFNGNGGTLGDVDLTTPSRVLDVSSLGPATDIIGVLAVVVDHLGGDVAASGRASAAGANTELIDASADFVSQGVKVGMRVRNATRSATATVTSVTATRLLISDPGAGKAFALNDRYELVAPLSHLSAASATGATTQLIDAKASFLEQGVLVGAEVRKVSGAGAGKRFVVSGVTATTLTFSPDPGAEAFVAGDRYAIDPLPDIVWAGVTSAYMGIFFQRTPRSFSLKQLVTGTSPSQIDTGDLNGDGLIDIAVPWLQESQLAVYYQNPDATSTTNTFSLPALLPTSTTPGGVAILDVNGDGDNDVVVSSRATNTLNVFLQRR